jgi:hypothetical protein
VPGSAGAFTPADQAAPDPAAPLPTRAPRPAGETYRGLPRRTRLANLSPHLRDAPVPRAADAAARGGASRGGASRGGASRGGTADPGAGAPTSTPAPDMLAAPLEIREPEAARDFAASLQGGWRRGRETDLPDTEAQATETRPPATPQTEEG